MRSQATMPDIETIISRVALDYGFSISDLRGSRGGKQVIRARQVAMYVLRMTQDHTLEELGRYINRCPATITYGFQKIAKQISEDKYLRNRVGFLCNKFNGE